MNKIYVCAYVFKLKRFFTIHMQVCWIILQFDLYWFPGFLTPIASYTSGSSLSIPTDFLAYQDKNKPETKQNKTCHSGNNAVNFLGK